MSYGVNINLDGYFYVKADSIEEAIDKVRNMSYNELIKHLAENGSLSVGDDVIEDDDDK